MNWGATGRTMFLERWSAGTPVYMESACSAHVHWFG